MKHLFLFLLIVGFGILTRAQTQYEVYNDADGKILKGLISKDLILNDPSFGWFRENQSGFLPDREAIRALASKRKTVEILVFGGTWNQDTRFFLPKFFKMTDLASFPEDRITLVGLGRDKKDFGPLAEEMHILSLPTFIILKEGKEIGRVTVSQKSAGWEKEIAAILNGQGLQSGEGKPLTARIVARIQRSYQLESRYDRLRKAGMLTVDEMAQVLGLHPQRVKIWNRHGLIRGHAYNGKNDCLYEHPGDNPPRKAQGVRFAKRVPAKPGGYAMCEGGAV